MSLSAPELGSDVLFFKPLQRNCVSSTEILHESTIARFYEDMLKEDNLKALQEKLKLPNYTKPIPTINNKLLAQTQIKEELKPEVVYDLTKIEDLDYSDTDSEEQYQNEKPRLSYPEVNHAPRRSPSETRENIQRILNERCQPKKEKLSIVLPEITKPTTEFSQGRYSPTSGTFHYPDLFMESLSKSPKFKPTANSIFEVVNEVIYRSPDQVESHSFSDQPRASLPEIKLTDENNYDYNLPQGEKLFPSSSSINDEKPSSSFNHRRYSKEDSRSSTSSGGRNSTSSINEYDRPVDDYDNPDDNWDDDESESEDSEDESDEYEDGENETYHPETVLSFERALEISNPTKYRAVSPTNDMFLESDSKFGLHYFNKSYVDNEDSDSYSGHDTRSRSGSEKPPKSILKCHRFSEQEDTAPVIHSSLPKSNSQKKQVRIEEPDKIEPQKPIEEHDPSSVVINHYSDIVKQYGYVQKSPNRVYLTYDELRAAAQLNDDDILMDKSNNDNDTINEHSTAHQYETIADSDIVKNASSEVEKVKNKVHFVFDFFLDIVMFAFACWLYCFKDERLAIPIIILMIYRQVCDKIKNKLPSFNMWHKKKSWIVL